MEKQLLKVAKFGGSSLSDEKVTDLLYACYEHAQNHNDKKFEETFEKIRARYLTLRDALCPAYNIEEELEGVYASFKRRLGKDHAASRGEYLCGRLMAACLGYPFVDPADCTNIRTTAKELQIPERRFTRFLQEHGFMYRCPAGALMPYNKPSNKGLFIVRDFCKNGHKGAYTLITPSGKDLLRVLGGQTGLFPVCPPALPIIFIKEEESP